MKTILILAIGFLPNIGGLETHLKDLIDELIKDNWKIIVLTYQPLNTPVLGKWIETSKDLRIYRLPSFRGLFYKLLKYPVLEFIFLEPLLFIITPIILLLNPDISVVNGQGIIAGFSASFWSKIFNKRYVVAAQSVYHFPKKGLYRQISRWIFNSANKIIAISTQTKKDIESLGVSSNKIIIYTNWENEDNYIPINKDKAKNKLGFKDKFIVSFFGRLVEEKGVNVLLAAIELCKLPIIFLIYGEGPLKESVHVAQKNNKKILYMGTVQPQELSIHYSAADLVVMPSLHEEGFGRVAAGALFCGTPVVASNRGALPEVVDERVGKIINPTATEIARAINFYFLNKAALRKCALNARKYALLKFSEKNAKAIISTFQV